MQITFTSENEEKIKGYAEKFGVSQQDFLNALIKCFDLSKITDFPISVGIDRAIANTEIFREEECFLEEMRIEKLKCVFLQSLLKEDSVFKGDITPNDVSGIIYSPSPKNFDDIMWR